MTKQFRMLAGGALMGISLLLVAPTAAAAPGQDNWGQEVKECNASNCYPGGTSRGDYVKGQARDGDGPGYGREIHDLANPGNSDPALP
ncbi:hypothetical protein [Rhodococcus chondri]|uniref:Uncharacterized protein n=1 Tax=Rhodococcus chondri TaxID=3065941 RepID=A0ABU7K095_9NOCA|nr:hypothetical protein [Rhodococcus sp. CC-R104]MEE2035234.1 hypothetical protein [Rhodococcus sp. CC-R104]